MKLIMFMATKNCELDAMPTALLKKILPHTIKVITHIVTSAYLREYLPGTGKWHW